MKHFDDESKCYQNKMDTVINISSCTILHMISNDIKNTNFVVFSTFKGEIFITATVYHTWCRYI